MGPRNVESQEYAESATSRTGARRRSPVQTEGHCLVAQHGVHRRPIASLIPLRSGEIFDRGKIGQGLENLRKAYGDRGYINLTYVPETQFDDPSGTITLHIDVDEGKQFRFGGGFVSGLPPAQIDSVIEAMAGWKGRLYTTPLMSEMIAKLRPLLPPCSSLPQQGGERFDEARGTVSLFLDFDDCYDDWPNSDSAIPVANCCPK
jgi:hypothetical protein